MKDIFIVDLDETLFDFELTERKNLTQTLVAHGISPDERMLKRFSLINDGLWKELERGNMTREKLKYERFLRLFEEFGISCPADGPADYYFKNFTEICIPFGGSEEFLKELKKLGRIYAATNGSSVVQRAKLNTSGYFKYFDGVFISEEAGCDKPSAQFAAFVTGHIDGYLPSRAVWIGDSLTSDMPCAKEAGCDFILFDPRGRQSFGGAYCRTYGGILSLLKSTV